jgi:excisionase family DNA binding protein
MAFSRGATKRFPTTAQEVRLNMARTSNIETMTTGQVAEICQVGVRTVQRWVDDGHLPSFGLPGNDKKSKERRIWRQDLIAFLLAIGNKRGAERAQAGSTALNVLVLASAHPWFEQLKKGVGEDSAIRLHYAHVVIEAGAVCANVQPQAAIVDFNISRADAFSVAGWLRRRGKVSLAALLPEDQNEAGNLRDYGFAAWWKKPVDPAAVCKWVKELAGG